MAGGRAVTEYDSADVSNQISLKQFSPLLRKVGKYILESDEPKTIAQAVRDLNLNEMSVWNTISRNRKNGNDFTAFIDQEAKSLLHANKVAVYRSVLDQAVSQTSTSHNQQKLFTLLVGDTKEGTNINIGALAIGININGLSGQDDTRSKGTVDIEPFIPKGK